MQLTQRQAQELLDMLKNIVDSYQKFDYTKKTLAVKSQDEREDFILDITPNRIKLTKITYQLRAKKSIILARVDIEGPPHRNPDDEEIPCPHLHIYREGFGDKWAMALPPLFSDCNNIMDYFDKFCEFCNIQGNPFTNTNNLMEYTWTT